jgi:hypothetical protein
VIPKMWAIFNGAAKDDAITDNLKFSKGSKGGLSLEDGPHLGNHQKATPQSRMLPMIIEASTSSWSADREHDGGEECHVINRYGDEETLVEHVGEFAGHKSGWW